MWANYKPFVHSIIQIIVFLNVCVLTDAYKPD